MREQREREMVMNVRQVLLLSGLLVSLACLPPPVEATDWAIGDVFAAIGDGHRADNETFAGVRPASPDGDVNGDVF